MCTHGLCSRSGPCFLLARAMFYGLEYGSSLNGESALPGDGSVCLVPQCPADSHGSMAPILFSSHGGSLLGVTSPVFHVSC